MTWNIIKKEAGKTQISVKISSLNSENGNLKDSKETSYAFNKSSLSTAENLNIDHSI
jgi:hypothetical protein